MTYSTSYFFSTICNTSVSVSNSNTILVFFKIAYHANPDADKRRSRINHVNMFPYIWFKSFEIHQPILIDHFERTNLDNDLDFLMQNPSKCVCNQHL